MLNLSNVIVDRTRPSTYTASDPVLVGGGAPYEFVWCATGRAADPGGPTSGTSKFLQATRSATTCYIRGLREVVEIQTTTSVPWQWRRIVFTMKLLPGYFQTTPGNFYLSNLTSAGYRRTVNEIYGFNQATLNSVLFAGSEGSDWDDFMIARVDTTRVTLKYDKTRTIATGNQNGMIRRYKYWHGFNKNIVYDDDEAGGQESGSTFSTGAKPGMGDVFVVDFLKPLGGSAATDRMVFRPNATLYWHEK